MLVQKQQPEAAPRKRGTAKANAGLTPAGKAFLVDANRIFEDCDASIRKAQRISRGEIGELSIGYMSPLTHDFLGKALEVWRQTAPGIVVDCVEMDSVSQERALLEGRISAAASQFVDVLAQTCAMENGKSRAPEIELKQLGSRQK